MLSHVFVGITDFERALAFYRPVLASLGIQERFCEAERPWAGWESTEVPHPGNGLMVAFMAATRSQVDTAHALALSLGGQCEGRPGLRPEYHANYYGAYFRDPDGNKLCVASHGQA